MDTEKRPLRLVEFPEGTIGIYLLDGEIVYRLFGEELRPRWIPSRYFDMYDVPPKRLARSGSDVRRGLRIGAAPEYYYMHVIPTPVDFNAEDLMDWIKADPVNAKGVGHFDVPATAW